MVAQRGAMLQQKDSRTRPDPNVRPPDTGFSAIDSGLPLPPLSIIAILRETGETKIPGLRSEPHLQRGVLDFPDGMNMSSY